MLLETWDVPMVKRGEVRSAGAKTMPERLGRRQPCEPLEDAWQQQHELCFTVFTFRITVHTLTLYSHNVLSSCVGLSDVVSREHTSGHADEDARSPCQ